MTNPTTYADLEIRILKREDAGYPVELTLNHERQFERGYVAPQEWVAGASPEADGRKLFEWLFADEPLKTAWARAQEQRPQRIRLRIDREAAELHIIPWELMIEPGEGKLAHHLASAAATPFSRYLTGTWQPGSPIFQRPIKILVAIANPANLSDFSLETIDVDQEWSLLQEAIAELSSDSKVELNQLPQPCTLKALAGELRQGYHILHFIGHGNYSQRSQQAILYMADEQNQVALITDDEFATMLSSQMANMNTRRDDKLRLVFLASCQTATRSPADAFRGLAPGLVDAGVPAVLAMQDLVTGDTARAFSQTFYRQLLQHGQVDQASNEARSDLQAARRSDAAIPVLFMRLREGQLLGQRGRITSDNEEMFWPFLLDNIDRGQCTPFLGPRVRAGLLPSLKTIAEQVADKYKYPLPDRDNLARVAQFVALTDPDGLRETFLELMQRGLYTSIGVELPKPAMSTDAPRSRRSQRSARMKINFTKAVEKLQWSEKALSLQENEIHHLLADLELPLYLTTNFDNFMVEALKYQGLKPRQVGPRWNPDNDTPKYVLTPEPSFEQPVVFHLNGYEGDPEQAAHLVLSEDDYLAHFARMAHEQEILLPTNILGMLAEHSFLFLGYQLDDWEFRVVLQGLLKQIAQTSRIKKPHVGVQLELDQAVDVDKARDYLKRYLGQFNIDIYWGTAQQFVTELHTRWIAWLGEQKED